jgi:hypothetical protein
VYWRLRLVPLLREIALCEHEDLGFVFDNQHYGHRLSPGRNMKANCEMILEFHSERLGQVSVGFRGLYRSQSEKCAILRRLRTLRG